VPLKYALVYEGNFSALVSIYAVDGTVAVTHGGIECGQGINTKVRSTTGCSQNRSR
jgi:xanthine dehydrogenase/oxidase